MVVISSTVVSYLLQCQYLIEFIVFFIGFGTSIRSVPQSRCINYIVLSFHFYQRTQAINLNLNVNEERKMTNDYYHHIYWKPTPYSIFVTSRDRTLNKLYIAILLTPLLPRIAKIFPRSPMPIIYPVLLYLFSMYHDTSGH